MHVYGAAGGLWPKAAMASAALGCISMLMVALASCTTTHTYKPGYAVFGRGGRGIPYLSTAEQQQLVQDEQRCQKENEFTITSNDPAALAALAGAAAGVLAAHGSASTRAQAGLESASNAANQAEASQQASLQPMVVEISQAAQWKVSDCLKSAGWDSMPQFMYSGRR